MRSCREAQRCVAQVEEQYRVGGQQVLWYVVSDCARLRARAAERYGAKVMLPGGEAPVEHLGFSSGNATRDVLAFRVAFAEQWLLGMTDFQVGSLSKRGKGWFHALHGHSHAAGWQSGAWGPLPGHLGSARCIFHWIAI